MKWLTRILGRGSAAHTDSRGEADSDFENVRLPAAIPSTASDEDIKVLIRAWVAALGSQDYAAALSMIWPVVLRGSGSLNHKRHRIWTPRVLEAVVNNYGVSEPVEGLDFKHLVAPVDARLRDAFEEGLEIDREPFVHFGQHYLGTIHVPIPLVYETGVDMSDMTARFFLKPVDGGMVLLLHDIHVL
jgi:hypothetical protein